MGAAQAKLSEQPEIIDLLRVLEQSKLMKERQEVESLVNYLDNMESQFGEVLKELKEVKGQLTQIQDKGVKASVTHLCEGAENKIEEIGGQLKTVRENIVKSARAAVQAFQEKGVGALQKAVAAMKIPSALSRLKEAFRGGKESMNDRADKMAVISSELHVIGSHTKNVGRILMGKAAKEMEPQNMDKGITARIEKAYLACGRGFERMEQGTDRAMKKLEKFVERGKKPSVKEELKKMKSEKASVSKLPVPQKEQGR